MNEMTGAAPPQAQLLNANPDGTLSVNWDLAAALAQAWNFGVRDSAQVTWAKVLIDLRASMAGEVQKLVAASRFSPPRATDGGPVTIGDTLSWKAPAFSQLAAAMQEIKDESACVGLTVLLYRTGPDGLESKVMWSAADGISTAHLHSALVLAAEDIRAGHGEDPGGAIRPAGRLN